MSAGSKTFKDYQSDRDEIVDLQKKFNDPEKYRVGEELRQAVNVALTLGQPLLNTGAPGTGKTQLAKRVAFELGLPQDLFPLVFNTKSISTARDLFYQYDALRHFHDAQIQKAKNDSNSGRSELPIESYITYEALGQAILLTCDPQDKQRQRVNDYLPPDLASLPALRPVVLIDEIDKAPRDLPNDVLNEIADMSFTVKEIVGNDNKPGLTFNSNPVNWPIVIITSNSERDLPEAFLRRCVFFHIEPPNQETLASIVRDRLQLPEMSSTTLNAFVQLFIKIRDDLGPSLKKAPATAELLFWMRILEREQLDLGQAKRDQLRQTLYTLVKSREDLTTMRTEMDRLIKEVLKGTGEAA